MRILCAIAGFALKVTGGVLFLVGVITDCVNSAWNRTFCFANFPLMLFAALIIASGELIDHLGKKKAN